jgi:hypothetical protein
MRARENLLFSVVLFFCLFTPPLTALDANQTNPEKKLSLQFIHRTRFVSWDNAVDLDREQDSGRTFSRHRTSLAAIWKMNPKLDFHLKLTNEFRYYFIPSGREFTMHEIFVDNLYLKLKNPASLPLVVTLGRQNIMLGEGFVVMDGHPLDGSRSIYFNAARIDLALSGEEKLTLFYMYQPEIDNWLPVLNDQRQGLIEQPEEGFGVYYSGRLQAAGLEAYFIRKNIKPTGTRPLKSGINTIGTRIVLPLTSIFSLTGELAFQGGYLGNKNRRALGGYFHLDCSLDDFFSRPASFTVGGILLSGDSPDTDNFEAWDPLFSRWPKWSESYIYTLIPEYGGRVAYWSNLVSLYAMFKVGLVPRTDLILTYHHLRACYAAYAGQPFPGGMGTHRGGLFIAKLNIKISPSLSGHVLWETFSPGGFYRPQSACYSWFRLELLYRI